MRIHLCGVRGSTPAPGVEFTRYGGHTPCVAVYHDGADAPTLVLDAGTGIREVTGLLGERPFKGTILLTHLHWDHVQGLPFFSAAERPRARTTLLLPEQEDGAEAAAVLARAMSPPHFPILPTELDGAWDFSTIAPGESSMEGFTVLAREVPHKGGRTFAYRISDGHSTLAYMPDHCPTSIGPGPDGWGDYHAAALEIASGADVLIHDAQLLADELFAEGRFGHSTVEYPMRLAELARARSLVLFHHRPDRSDEALDRLAERFADEPATSVAIQGSVLEL